MWEKYRRIRGAKRIYTEYILCSHDQRDTRDIFIHIRGWKQFHNPKDLAISISLEAAELLEVFQWSAEDVKCEKKMDKIKEELADVVNYCILMADVCGLDLDEIVHEKIILNNKKYPVEKALGSKEKYTGL